MNKRRLTTNEKNLLRESIANQRPSLLPLIDAFEVKGLTMEEREDLRGALADELAQTGLRHNDEPNERGLLLEDLIDRMGSY